MESSQFSIATTLDPRLHAHTSGGKFSKTTPTKQAREIAKLLAIQAGAKPIRGPVVVDYRFTVPDRRRRDLANMLQSCKPYVDGVVDSGLIAGDHWEVMAIGEVSVVVGKQLAVELVFRGV